MQVYGNKKKVKPINANENKKLLEMKFNPKDTDEVTRRNHSLTKQSQGRRRPVQNPVLKIQSEK